MPVRVNNKDIPIAAPTCSSLTISATDGKKRPSQPLPESPVKNAKENKIGREKIILFKNRAKNIVVRKNIKLKIKKAFLRLAFRNLS